MTLALSVILLAVLSSLLAWSGIRAIRTGWIGEFKVGGCYRQQNPGLFTFGVVTKLVGSLFFGAGAVVCPIVFGSAPSLPLRKGWPLVAILAVMVLSIAVQMFWLEPFSKTYGHRVKSVAFWSFKQQRKVLNEIIQERLEEREARKKPGSS
jgi:hypothetical protein